MKRKTLSLLVMLSMIAGWTIVMSSCGGIGESVGSYYNSDEPFALVNEYDEFLSIDSDGSTLTLSRKPCKWRIENNGEGNHIVSCDDPELMFDLDNAVYEEGNSVHLFEDTGNKCQYWELAANEDGYIIVSAEKPEWCVKSEYKGFTLGTARSAEGVDRWRISSGGGWQDSAYPEDAVPKERNIESFTPSPEFWEAFDASGITADMIAESVHHEKNDAHYLTIDPLLEDITEGFDFFSVDFCTDSLADSTYWSLANWDMDKEAYMKRNGYTGYDGGFGYGGFQDVGDHNTKIMSIWETYFSNDSGSKYTLLPKCVYPADQSNYFDGEGSGTSLVAPFDWKEGTWYRYVLRSWQANDTTYVGTWAQDLSTGEVTLLAIYDTLLPESFITEVPSQFLENFYEDHYGEYRQIKLRNFCVRGAHSQDWYYIDKVRFGIWYDLGYNQGSFRYTVDEDTVIGETCGLGENVCEGLSEDEIIKTFSLTAVKRKPDAVSYEIPDDFR